eukprot:g15609.t1
MSGPTPRLPFLTASEEACLRPGPSGRVLGVATSGDFFTLFLRDASEFAGQYHATLGDRAYEEWPWEEDGQKQYEGSLRKVQFMSPVRNAPELSNETRVDEEQRWVSRGHAHATLEIRRKLPELRDGSRFVVAVRWVMKFDGFGCTLAVFCGTLFYKPSSYAKEIREGCVRGYALSVKRWFAQAEKYAKTHGQVQLRHSNASSLKDGVSGDGSVEDGGPAGGVGEGAEAKKGNRLKMSGRVPVLEAMRSSVGSSNSIQLSKCHRFLGEYIYLTREVKRVIQGEAAGDLVLEEDLKCGGRGIPIGQEGAGAGLDGLDGRRPKPYGAAGDIEESSVMSHISVESARSGSWSGSVVGGFGFVDYPAGIPLKQWGRIQDRTVRWLIRSMDGNPSTMLAAAATGGNREKEGSVVSGSTNFSGGRGSTGARLLSLANTSGKGGWGPGAGIPGGEGPLSPSAASTREDDVVHAKWLEQLRVVAQRDRKAEDSPSSSKANKKKRSREDEKKGSASEESKQQQQQQQPPLPSGGSVNADDEAEPTHRKNRSVSASSARSASSRRDAVVEREPSLGLVGGEDDISSDGNTADGTLDENQDAAGVSDPAEGAEATTAGRAAAEKPYTVVFHGRRLGIQLREVHKIPIVGGLQGYDPDGTQEGREDGEDDEDEEGSDGLPIEVAAEESAFDALSLARLGTVGGAGGGTGTDDLQTIYGGSGAGGGVGTETSSMRDSQSEYDITVKCIVQCSQLFGEGVKKLWRWKPSAATSSNDEGGTVTSAGVAGVDSTTAVSAFMRGLSQRLGLGDNTRNVRVSYLDMEVGDGEGDYVSLDAEAWDDFLESRFKRLSVSLDPDQGGGGSSSAPAVAGTKDPADASGGGDDASATASATATSDSRQPEQPERLSEERLKGRAGTAAQSTDGAAPSLAEISEDDEDEEEDEEERADRRKTETEEGVQEFPDRVTVKMQALKGNEAQVGGDDVHGYGQRPSGREEGGEGEEDEEEDSGGRGGGGGEAEEGGVQEFPDSITAKMQALRGRLSRVAHSTASKSVFDDPSASEASAKEGVHQEGPGRSYSGGPGGYKEGGAGGGGWAVDEDEEHDKGFGGPGKEGANAGGVRRGEDRRGVYDDIDESFTAELSARSTGISTAGKVARRPCVGSVLVSVNGVRTQGLSFANVVQLLNTRERPMVLEFVDSWDTIFHQHHMETQAREKISRETFEQKLRHPLAAKLRKQVEEWMSAFREQDLRAMVAEPQADDDEQDQRGMEDTQQGPAVMLWSLIRWLEQELPDVGIFNNNHRAGGGLPAMGDLQWNDVKQHLERNIFEQVFDRCLTSAPDYGRGDEELTAKLASLRFLRPRHWCVDSLKDTESAGSYGREWELAQGELCRLMEYRCPLDMLDCVRACVRLVALSVEASLAKRQRELEEAAAAAAAAGGAKGVGGSGSSKSGGPRRVALGADDLLPALTWVVVQSNPPRLASRLWFTHYYMRAGVEGMGEGAYCLTQLASALEFASHADASVLADITEDELTEGLERHEATQSMIKAAAEGDIESVSFWLGAGADPNGLSSDQQSTALTAAITHRRRGVIKILLEGPGSEMVDPNMQICPNYGVQRGRSALMLAAAMGDMTTVLALLRMPGVDRRLACTHGKDAVDYAVQHGHLDVASVLLADPNKATLCQAAKAGSLSYVKALLLQGQDPNQTDYSGQYTPLIAAAFLAHIQVLETLLASPLCDPDRPNVRGETALMYCSQREGYATGDTQVAAAVRLLAKGADRHLRDHEGRTAMDWANRFGSTRLLDVLLFDPNMVKIFLIARERDVRGVLALMEQGVDPNTTCPERNYTPLIAAVFNQDEDMASALLSHRTTDVNGPGRHGMTPLMYAAQAGHDRMAVLLLRLRADRYRCNDQGETALEIAAVRGHMSVVNVLKYDPERLSICAAAANDDAPAVDGLLSQGVHVDSRHRLRTSRGWHHERYTPLISACSQGHAGMAKRLLDAGATPNLPNMLGQTPLMYAANFGTEELVLMLLEALKPGGRKDVDSQGRTALRFAENLGHEEVACILRVDPAVSTIQEAAAAGSVHEVWALMRQGVSGNEARMTSMTRLFESPRVANLPDIMVRANQYRSALEPEEYMLTPLAAAAIFSRNLVIEALLADPAVKVDVRDALGRTPLMHAARFGSEGCVLRLLSHGAARYKKDKAGRMTASDLAIAAGHLHIAGIVSADPKWLDLMEIAAQGRVVLLNGLVKQGVSLNYVDPSNPYLTPLIAASANGREECVRIILQCPGVQVNRANAKGETALMHGSASGNLKIVRMLMQHGANPMARDRRNRNAEHWAYKQGHMNMVLVKVVVWWTPPLKKY